MEKKRSRFVTMMMVSVGGFGGDVGDYDENDHIVDGDIDVDDNDEYNQATREVARLETGGDLR